ATQVVLSVFRANGLLLAAGDLLAADLGLTPARSQGLGARTLPTPPRTRPPRPHRCALAGAGGDHPRTAAADRAPDRPADGPDTPKRARHREPVGPRRPARSGAQRRPSPLTAGPLDRPGPD